MNIREAKEEIKRTIQAYTAKTSDGVYRIPTVRQRPILLMGPPGIGKTAIMEQAAGECGLGLVAYTMTHHTRQSAIGLPKIEKKSFGGREYAVTDYTMSEILASVYEQIERTGRSEGILFLDEINCVSETLMPALLQFLQYKTFGSHKLPEGWIVAAAGNPVRYNQSVRELDMAVLDRVKWMEIEPELSVWKSYARNQKIHPAVLSFLEWKPESFYAAGTDGGGRSFVTARGWEDLSRMLTTLEELGLEVTDALPGQYLQHREIAAEFGIYYRMYEACKKAPYQEISRLPYDERLCVLQLMLQRVYRLSDRWKKAGELLESLEYFFMGCQQKMKAAQKGDIRQRLAFCEYQLEQRQQGMLVKKECGILSYQEEEKEAVLAGKIRKQLGDWRLEAAGGNRRNKDGAGQKEELPLETEQDIRNTKVCEEQIREKRQTAEDLEALLAEYAGFMEQTFAGRQEWFLFCLGLMEHENTEKFLKTQMPELLKSLQKGRNLEQAEAELREKLFSFSEEAGQRL